jgi:hypothetical protein
MSVHTSNHPRYFPPYRAVSKRVSKYDSLSLSFHKPRLPILHIAHTDFELARKDYAPMGGATQQPLCPFTSPLTYFLYTKTHPTAYISLLPAYPPKHTHTHTQSFLLPPKTHSFRTKTLENRYLLYHAFGEQHAWSK